MNYQFSPNIQLNEYDVFVEQHPYSNLLQSAKWANIKQNWDHIYTGVYEQQQLVGAALVLIKRLPAGFTMFYIPRGPVVDMKNQLLLTFFIKELKKLAKQYRCLFIKMDPGIHINDYKIEDENTNIYDDTSVYLENFRLAGAKHQGFVKSIAQSIQPRYQANVYNEEGWEEALPRHTKRLINDALKRKVEISVCGIEAVDTFTQVVALTEARKNVALRNHDYFLLLMHTYGDDAKIFLAEVDIMKNLEFMRQAYQNNENEIANCPENAKKKMRRLMDIKASLEKDVKEFEIFAQEYPTRTAIAGILSIKYGDTMEMLYAGMNDKFKKFMPQYYLYTENFKWAFEHGCKYANMGGVEGDLQDGLTKFKSNFNPYINEFIGEFDVPVNSILYTLSSWAMKMRKKIMNRH